MNWFFTRRYLAVWLTILTSLAVSSLSQAQTITITAISPAAPCPGSPISVTFTTTGSFSATNTFTLLLSSGNGDTSSPTSITTLSAVPTSATTLTMTGTLPATAVLPYDVGYKFWIRSSNPVRTSGFTNSMAIGVDKPVVTNKTFCLNSGLQPISTSSTGTIDWYNSSTDPAIALSNAATYNVPTASAATYYVTRTVNNCRSARASVNVTLESPPSSAPNATLPAAYCPTNPPVLSATLTGTGTSFRWYTSPTSASLASAPLAPTIPGSYSYSVSQLSPIGCESSRKEIPIRVYDAAPATPPSVPNPNPSFCRYDLPATLTASTTGTGTSLYWTGPGITTPVNGSALSLGTTAQAGTYQVRQENANGCQSQPQNVIVKISDRPDVLTVANVSVCQNEAQQTLSASGATGNLTWYVQGSNTALPGAPRPSTSQPNSQTIYEVTQTDGNNCTSQRSAGLTFFVRPLPARPTVSSTYIYCEAQAPASLTASGATIRWYTDGGSNRGTFLASNTINAPRSAGSYTYQVTQTDANNCQSDFLAVPVQVKDTPNAPTVNYSNNIANFCQGQGSYQLAATGDRLKWYTAPGSTSLTQAPSPATTSQGDTPYYVTQTNNDGCQSDPRTVTARVNATPGAPTSAQSRTYCAGASATPLTATEPGILWYSAATGGTGNGQAPTPSTAANNVGTTQLFYVSQTVTGCESQQRQQVSVTIKRKPDLPTNISSPAFCQTYAPTSLSAQPESGATLIWVTNGSESASAPVPPNNVARTYTYQVLQTLNGCRSEPVPVSVTVKQTPGQPGITPYSLCFGRESRPLQVNGTELKYYDANDQLLGTTAPSPNTGQVNTTGIVYKVTQSIDGCEGPKITYNVPVYAIPANPGFTQPRDYCAEDVATAIAASGQNLLWYSSATGGNGSGQSPTPSTAATNVGTSQVFYVTQTQNNCESLRQQINVTVKRKPALPTTTSNVEFCQTYGAPTLTATPENGASIIWLVDGRESATGPTPQNDAVRTYTYQVLQDLNGCRSNQATVTVRVKSTPGVPGITPFQLCQLSPGRALQANGTNLKFYDANNSLLGSTPPVLPTDLARTLTYKVSQSTDGCEGSKIDYVVVVQPKPAPPATQAVTYCLESSNNPDQPKQAVQPLTAQGQNLRWYYIDGNAYPDNFTPTPGVTSTYSLDFRVTQTINNCISDQALLRVTVQANPAPVISTSLVTYCRNDVARPLEATGAGLRWLDPNGQLLPQSGQNPTPPTANATKGGETYQVYSVSSSGCVSPRNTIRLVVNTNPTLGLLGSTTVNYGQSASLKLLFTSSPPYTYTLTDGTSGIANDTLSSVSVKPLQTTTYRVASVSNVCGIGLPGNPATATIFVNIPTITTQALAAGTVCAGSSFAVAYTTAGVFNTGNAFKVQLADTTSKNYIDVSNTSLGSTITANVPATLKGGVYFVRILATNPGAEVPGQRSPTILTIRGLPAAVLAGNQSVYEGSPASLSIALSGDGPWSISYSSTIDGTQAATSTFQTNANPHILSVIPLKTATYFLTAVSNNCSSGGPVSGSAVITVLPLLAVENPLLNMVSLYPVPTQNLLTVAIDLPLTAREPAQLTLSNLAGLPVLNRQTDTRQTVLDLSQQPAGLYLLNVQVGEHRLVRKIMKQ